MARVRESEDKLMKEDLKNKAINLTSKGSKRSLRRRKAEKFASAKPEEAKSIIFFIKRAKRELRRIENLKLKEASLMKILPSDWNNIKKRNKIVKELAKISDQITKCYSRYQFYKHNYLNQFN